MPLEIITSSLPNAYVGQAYNAQMQAAGGTPPYNGWFIGEILPDSYWLTISPTGLLSGTPQSTEADQVAIGLYDSASPPNYAQIILPLSVLASQSSGVLGTSIANTMLTQTLPAYPYQEYADDENIAALFNAYNDGVNAYVSWFANIGLPYYPGLTGSLLNWIAQGIYGQMRYSAAASPATSAIGPLNSAALNTIPLNTYIAPTQTYYAVTDDIFQRILTWNFFKGDGKRWCPRFLKRRVMRFVLGTNGIDPEPWNAGFTVGAESTQAISVQFVGSTCVISINQLAASALTQLTPNILQIFAALFLAPGVLDKPVEWNYSVNISTSLTVLVSPASINYLGATGTETSGSTTAVALGGSGLYTYAWSWQSGGSGITINSPTSATTTFTASGLASGGSDSGVAQIVVTDTSSHSTASNTVPVVITRVSLPQVTVAPTTINAAGTNANVTTGTVTGTAANGQAPYVYLWSWQSGGAGITINTPASAATTFTGSGLAYGGSNSGVALLTVTDNFGQMATATCAVSVERATELLASASPTSLSYTGASSSETTASSTVTPAGGISPYRYSWAWASGGAGITINSAMAATTTFTAGSIAAGTTASGTAVCIVTDSGGQTAQSTVAVSISRVTLITASASPSTISVSKSGTTITTGATTVSASGGSGSYTYSWTWASGGTSITINSPSAATTSFTGSGLVLNDTYSGVARCTVTDGYGQTATVAVSVSIKAVPVGTATIAWAQTNLGGDVFSFGTGTIVSQSIPSGTLILAETIDNNGSYTTSIAIEMSANPGQDFFTTMETPLGNLATASASYSYNDGVASWGWPGSSLWASGVAGHQYTINLA
jgi:hypothetical protein